ncbi:MAG: protein-export chaperone SecB [Cardiobacteriaceae bacterium]|nr:protein-export chaperone SecB [Cardiobacteriaceae bacterium]
MSEEVKQGLVLELRKLYVSDLSIEVPHAPAIFQEEFEPELSLGVTHEGERLPEENYHNVKLRLTLTAKTAEDKTVYLVEVVQGGVFEISGLTDVQLHHAIHVYCPSVLFAYAREAVSNALYRAGFPNLFLSPVNFEMIYQERMQALIAEQAEQEAKKDDK